ncbi:MAG: metallophosphoesterase [Bacteroidetes bacterium]|nr:metallophosphoesterase [Bacteroidota bacterium]
MKFLRYRILLPFLMLCVSLSLDMAMVSGQTCKPVRVGILTDCQYCNCASNGKRNYSLSLSKLDSCISTFNSLSLDAVFHLGDMIDHDFTSFDSVIPRFEQFRPPVHLVLGNHDYMIKRRFKPELLNRLGMKEDHYIVDIEAWRFIVLNGDDLSYFAPQNKEQKQERNEIVSDQYGQLRLNGMPWNGGIGKRQMAWLEQWLDDSEQSGMNVIVLCHFPLFTKDNHNMFNNNQLFQLISNYACVKAYFCGHYHSGSYKVKDGIHIVNFKGMVDTEINAFSMVTLTSDSILIKGYGRETERKLKLK